MQIPHHPTTSLPAFAHLSNIRLNGLSLHTTSTAGTGLQFTSRDHDASRPLLTVGRDLVVCAATVEEYAKSDPHLAEVLRAVGEFAMTPRGAIMLFLVVTWGVAAGLGVGQRTGWCEYVKFLPSHVSVPTTWTDAERKLLEGTSLQMAVKAKLQTLSQEFEHLQSSTSHIKWCADLWWADQTLTLADWTHLDSLFRSRVLQFPRFGISLAPLLDFANHADDATAYYSIDSNRDVVLLLAQGASKSKPQLRDGEEVTINYGIEKSAAELVFSYGFLPRSRTAALWLALDLKCPPDDPLAPAKEAVFRSTPILRLIDLGAQIMWTGPFVWLMCINEEDGLSFRVLQATDGTRQLKVVWDGEEMDDVGRLEGMLEESGLWEVYQLRALMLVQERVRVQLGELVRVGGELEGEGGGEGGGPREVAERLRVLERALMEKIVVLLEDQKEKLLETEVVREYLRRAGGDSSEEGRIEVEVGGNKIDDDNDDDDDDLS
ncbi:hypothetical protein Q9L58_003020 [Maublancomyces gigas]|uniref:SET domain-containing protein n=1 Tax=Discina gigas TaxID=1032678 RepID=A0ABR3GPU7_9PEZI